AGWKRDRRRSERCCAAPARRRARIRPPRRLDEAEQRTSDIPPEVLWCRDLQPAKARSVPRPLGFLVATLVPDRLAHRHAIESGSFRQWAAAESTGAGPRQPRRQWSYRAFAHARGFWREASARHGQNARERAVRRLLVRGATERGNRPLFGAHRHAQIAVKSRPCRSTGAARD